MCTRILKCLFRYITPHSDITQFISGRFCGRTSFVALKIAWAIIQVNSQEDYKGNRLFSHDLTGSSDVGLIFSSDKKSGGHNIAKQTL